MFVCICHALTDADVASASEEGATREDEVFTRFGVRPQCGRCIPSMRGLLGCAGKCPAAEASDEKKTRREE